MSIKVKGKYDRPIHFYAFGWLLAFIFTYAIHSLTTFYLVLFLCQLITLILFIYYWYKAFSVYNWVETPLIKISHGCDQYNHIGSEYIDILINYEYEFNSINYISKSIQYPFYFVSNNVKSTLLKSIDDKVIKSVYVNPNNPKQAVLLRGISIHDIYVSISYILCAISIMLVSTFYLLDYINN